jgi:hypothetical protein
MNFLLFVGDNYHRTDLRLTALSTKVAKLFETGLMPGNTLHRTGIIGSERKRFF